ncbi:16S rRNA (guanine966-N2)-methyltransferase [Faunimonas pinastri]|uniref:16S rRNA (Guanine966-N2)-methyltransferase n=1 Tax=Faunimonas pinastri TaxID=1855383 RepID=A0A1H8ZKQ7_9HYPH|nr:16S rRNA (guanine(966)-N(2))-methyltransferase RsmD [Faunimonas pinastri]SEP65042.1 16S rRNA (guanine966-N2)-methyltransferase [Faunimonas pinastri]
MRIVGGRLKGRALAGPKTGEIRPTSDRLRESLFNILHHSYDLPVEGTRVLDLFAGTGALAVEAISRGAAHATFVETGPEGRGIIRTNVEAFGLSGVAKILRRDATDLGAAGTITPFDLVFCDPPYGKGLGERALESARSGGWLKPETVCVLEERAGLEVALPPAFEQVDHREVGESQMFLLRLRDAAAP